MNNISPAPVAGTLPGENLLDDQTPFGERRPGLPERLAWNACGVHAVLRIPGTPLWKRVGRRYPGPFDQRVGGRRFRIYPTQNFSDRKIAYGQLPERTELQMIRPFLSPGGSFIDIGANIGIYTIEASLRLAGGRVLAVEPHPLTIRKLMFNIAANGCEGVIVEQCALGERAGHVKLHPDAGKNAGRSSLLRDAVGEPGVPVTVAMASLAQLLERHDMPAANLLKIDVEGYEDRILGAFLTEADPIYFPDAMLVETVHRAMWKFDIVARLQEHGYRMVGATGQNLLLARTHQGTESGERKEG